MYSFSISAERLIDTIGTPRAPILYDTRRTKTFDKAERVIACAKWRDRQSVDEWYADIPDGADIVVYCVHGHQLSQSTAGHLRAKGINARFLTGGIDAYEAAGGITIAKSEQLPQTYAKPTRWVTRERPKVDRIACPWFIRRFVDPEAEILYVEADWVTGTAAELDAIPIDIPDTEYGHHGEACTFDAFLNRFGVFDDGLTRLAQIVRAADTNRFGDAPEAAGLRALSLGLSDADQDDHAVLEKGMVLYDALYSWCRSTGTEQ